MMPENIMVILSSISLELDENIVFVCVSKNGNELVCEWLELKLRVLIGSRGTQFVVQRNLLELKRSKTTSISIEATIFGFKLKTWTIRECHIVIGRAL
jgi:hypothetical protein